ncbi:MAG: phosphotransferase [Proteobacteria bacterium]|nr:phosphotransferase [Pseudomonadota bacterium]
MLIGGRSVIATRRRTPQRAELEAQVLRALRGQGAPVPAVLAYDGDWLIQEDLGRRRLSQALAAAAPGEGERWLDTALAGLAATQRAGRAAGLARRVVVIGARPDWIRTLIGGPERLAGHLGLPAPALDAEALGAALAVRAPRFIKWDARPGNAIAGDDGRLSWFDFEHCGCRNPLDDLAWLLGDEYVPDWPEAEARLLGKWLPGFAPEPRAGLEYLMTFGVFHMCVRLALILSNKGEDPWWDWDYCLAGDKVGVVREAAVRTAGRAARWAAAAPLAAVLSPWLEAVGRRLAEME